MIELRSWVSSLLNRDAKNSIVENGIDLEKIVSLKTLSYLSQGSIALCEHLFIMGRVDYKVK